MTGGVAAADWRADRIGAALRGANPTVMARQRASFAVIGDVQFLPGYSVALVDRPGVERLSELPRAERWHDPATALGPRHDALRRGIRTALADVVSG
ncbi:MAG: hypothetical protein INR72_14980 [Williamsia herbipolensis]|nr:hypothetical protein [Williamsia herbipolensis]